MSHSSFPDEFSPARRLQALLRHNLGAFTERCFCELSPAQSFLHSWHMDALTYRLNEVVAGRCRRLLITLPPRSLKSLSASIALPAWVLGRRPDKRVICVSYANDLTVAHSNSFRAVVNSAWYRNLFPAMRIDAKKDTETELRTTLGGFRLSTTVGGSLTGRGGSLVIIDDPIKAADAQSEAARRKVITWFDETLLSRLDDKRNDAIIIVMQRLHVDDLAGHVLKSGDWTHLDLPAIAEHDAIIQTGPHTVYRRKAGELLHPEREPLAVLEALRTGMGSAAFSAQYQQRPVPAGGHMIDWKWFGQWTGEHPKGYSRKIVQSWDTASKAAEISDYSACVTALVSKDEIRILNVVRERLEYPALKKRIVSEKQRWRADTVLIEDKGSGTSLIQDLRSDKIFAIAINPEGDKIVRMSACSARIESGCVLLPPFAPWLDLFRIELLAFPHGTHDDQVDALSQLINWTRTRSRYTLDNIY